MKTIMLVENDEVEGQQIKQWILTEIPDSQVLWFYNTQDAENKLKEYTQTNGVIDCIVLDMFFPDFTGQEPLGRHILEGYWEYPIILISKLQKTRGYVQQKEGVPLLQLDKPLNWSSTSDPKAKLQLHEFRRDLIKAVKCGLLVGSLQAEVERLNEKQVLRPLRETCTFWAAVSFLVFVALYAISVPYLAEWLQHLLLALCAVMGVHLLDRAMLIKDFRDAFKSVGKQLTELSISVQRNTQEGSDALESISKQLKKICETKDQRSSSSRNA